MTAAEKRITDLEARMDEAERQIGLLWEEIRKLWEKMGDTEDRVSALEDKMGEVEDDLEELTERVDAMSVRITNEAEDRISEGGRYPAAPGEALIRIETGQTDSGKSDTVAKFQMVIVFVIPPGDYWVYVNFIPANYGNTPDNALDNVNIQLQNATQLDYQGGYSGNPYGCPLGYGRIKIHNTGEAVRIDSTCTVGLTGFVPTQWPDSNVSSTIGKLNFKQGQSKIITNASSYLGSITPA